MKILLKQIRSNKNISLRKLAVLTGVSKTHLSRIENNESIPTIFVMCRIAKALDVRLDDLVEY